MRKIALAFVALGACTTVQDVRGQAPLIETRSAKSLGELTQCFARQWQNAGGEVSTTPTANGAEQLLSMTFQTSFAVALINVEERQAERFVVARARKADTPNIRRKVESCL